MSNWYLQNGKESDIVLSSRVRLARNLKEYNFPGNTATDESEKVLKKIEEITPGIGYGLKFLKLENMDELTKISLVEKHLISPEFALDNKQNKAILINDEENICIMVNEEDHLRLQTFCSGLEIDNLVGLIQEIDEQLENQIDYAYDKQFGYLTACPTNVGTGMRISIMVHLPALTITGNISKVLRAVNNFGMSIRGVYGEGSESKGDVYQIFNTQSLGQSEKDIVKNVKAITEKIIEQEHLARKKLTKIPINLEDKVYRSYGLLVNAKKMSSDEALQLLSDVKLGVDLGIIKELNDEKIRKIELFTKPGNLQKIQGKILTTIERDIERCNIIKNIINERM